jgi:CPA2 family monovalent cation:H+ antiporter-2
VLLHEPLPLLAVLAVVLIGTPLTAFLLLRAFRRSWSTALTIAAGLAQIGEFSFILAGLGVGLGMIPGAVRDLILGASILSIFVNPVLFHLLRRFRPWIDRLDGVVPPPAAREAARPVLVRTALAGHAILVGYGRVGRLVAEGLVAAGWPVLVIEAGEGTARGLAESGVEVITGNAASPAVLEAANIAGARLLIVAIPEAFEAGQIVQQARAANPAVAIIARAHFDLEVTHLTKLGAGVVVMGEREIARSMLEHTEALAAG